MAVMTLPRQPASAYYKRRRTATAVMAGDFDIRPRRDVLTSLLNGVGIYSAVEKQEEGARRARKRERKEREKEKEREKARRRAQDVQEQQQATTANAVTPIASTSISAPLPRSIPSQPVRSSKEKAAPERTAVPTLPASSFWRSRPAIFIPSMVRSASVTPPPMPPSPASTPDSSVATSRNSSKRPRTPEDDEDMDDATVIMDNQSTPPPRKKRVAARKGWKGWVEGSPPPSDKLINLDRAIVLTERRTRSGKNFDAIGEGMEGWVESL